MKQRLMATIPMAVSLMAVAETRTMATWVFGFGIAREDERDAAVSQETEQAVPQANAVRSGSAVEMEKGAEQVFWRRRPSLHVHGVSDGRLPSPVR
jgi:hypothetical protein